jgi:hypothetical protein
LIIIEAKKDLFGDNDDRDNEIAERWAHETKHVYTISITDVSPITLEIGETRKLNYEVYDNGTLMTTIPEVIFDIDDTSVATIDSIGNITASYVGSATVTCRLKDTPTISVSYTIKVLQEVIKEYSITLTYSTLDVRVGGWAETIKAVIYYGNTQASDKSVIWTVKNVDGTETNMVVLVDNGDNSCSISAVENYDNLGQSVILKAQLTDDSNVKNEVSINIIGLW